LTHHPSKSRRRSFILAPFILLAATGCNEASSGDSPFAATSAAATAAQTPTAAATPSSGSTAAAGAQTVTCKALIAQIVQLGEASKKEGIINKRNADKMQARCEKSNNIKDNQDVVTCIMSAKDEPGEEACKGLGGLLGPW
jgi:hypothetical protein